MKRFARRILLLLGSWLCRDSSPKTVFFHDVGRDYTPMGTPRELFWNLMGCLRRGDRVCFDDGFRGAWDERERLRGVAPTVFVAVDLVGRPGYLSWEEIRTLQDEYGFDFQCHTWSHQTLAGPFNDEVLAPAEGRTEEWFRHELVDSKAELERRLGRRVTSICFPVGRFSDDVVRRCVAAGYEAAYASYPGGATDGYVRPRCLAQNMSVAEFRLVLKGGMNLLARRYLKMHKT